jgi:CheY-like chemotaxis protein
MDSVVSSRWPTDLDLIGDGNVLVVDDGDIAERPGPVLVVDDDDAVRTSFAAVLRVAGFEVVEAADGFMALETLRTHAVAAVVLDVRMPVLDGFAVLDRLIDNPPPVVLATAHPYDAEVMRRREKVFGFIHKPVPPDSLIAMVAKAVAARSR